MGGSPVPWEVPPILPRLLAPGSVRRLLLLVTSLTLAYQSLLGALDAWVFPWPPLPGGYYALNTAAPLGVLLGDLRPPLKARLGRAFLPLMIGVLGLAPLVSTYLLVPPAVRAARPLGGALATEGLVLRILPVLALVLVLTALHYRWPPVVGYSLGLAVVQGALLLHGTAGLRSAIAAPRRAAWSSPPSRSPWPC